MGHVPKGFIEDGDEEHGLVGHDGGVAVISRHRPPGSNAGSISFGLANLGKVAFNL